MLKVAVLDQGEHLGVKTIKRATLGTTADGDGVVGHAGAVLLAELADRLGLPVCWTAGRLRPASPGSAPDGPGADRPAVMLVHGRHCLNDLAALRDQPEWWAGQVVKLP